ncbi:MAG: class A beta-lactamase-related serine hydrolase [Lachnospiraceae bacterium]|jgi:hypothetical protein|nr:class A beta-lactamase-related serine hydrolase [Lachnospiraceae bacterium]
MFNKYKAPKAPRKSKKTSVRIWALNWKRKRQAKRLVAKRLPAQNQGYLYSLTFYAMITALITFISLPLLADIIFTPIMATFDSQIDNTAKAIASVNLSKQDTSSTAWLFDPDFDKQFWEDAGLPSSDDEPPVSTTAVTEVTTVTTTVTPTTTEVPQTTTAPETTAAETEVTTSYPEAPTSASDSDSAFNKTTYESGYESFLLSSNEFVFSADAIQKLDNFYAENPNYNISFALKDPYTGEIILQYKPDRVFGGASTVKAPFCWYVLTECICTEAHTHTDDCITLDTTYVYNYAEDAYTAEKNSPLRERAKEDEVFTLKDIIWYTLYYSDDDGYQMLRNRFGTTDFDKKMESIGSSDTLGWMKYGNATVSDRLLEWQYIYAFCKSGTPEADFMDETLNNTSYAFWYNGTGIPAHHKSGWSGTNGVCHDGGIFHSMYGDFMFMVLTQHTANNRYSDEIVSNFSATLYDVFTEYGEFIS